MNETVKWLIRNHPFDPRFIEGMILGYEQATKAIENWPDDDKSEAIANIKANLSIVKEHIV